MFDNTPVLGRSESAQIATNKVLRNTYALLGLTMPFLALPGMAIGWFLGEQMKRNQAREAVDQQLVQVFGTVRSSMPDRLASMVDHWFAQIFHSTQQRVVAEQDKITAIEQQLDTDHQARAALRDRLHTASTEIKKIMAST